MLKYDQEVITKLKSQILSAITLLEEIKLNNLETLRNDLHLISSAKYNLIVAIEASIDICNHLISKNSYRAPDSYSDSFYVLAENKIISHDLVDDKLAAMARFRNRLVHLYWDVEVDALYNILQNNLVDMKEFLDQIKQQL